MELEEMQAAWNEMSSELDKQKQITNDIIMKMTQQRYANTWNHIRTFELIGTFICYGAIIYLLVNFGKLDTTPLFISGIVTTIILAILPILSLKTIRGMKEVTTTTRTVKETMEIYSKRKTQFINFQKLNIVVSFLFMLVIIPVGSKVINNKDLFVKFDNKLLVAMPIMLILFAVLIWFVTKTYKKVLNKSEHLIDEMTNHS